MKKINSKLKFVLLILLVIVIVGTPVFLYASFAPYGRHKVANKEPLVTEEIFLKPDSIAVIRGGVAKVVSNEQRDKLYEIISKMEKDAWQMNQLSKCGCHDPFDQKDIFAATVFHTAIEFRYNQRVKLVGKHFFEDYALNMQIEMDCSAYPVEFDAFLFSFGTNGSVLVSRYKDGEYNGLGGLKFEMKFEKEDLKAYKKAVKDII